MRRRCSAGCLSAPRPRATRLQRRQARCVPARTCHAPLPAAPSARSPCVVERAITDRPACCACVLSSCVQGDGGETSGLYSDAALREEARRRKEEKDRLLKLENVAKLPPDMWAETMGSLEESKKEELRQENKELASQMEDGAWQKHLANMSPEKIEEAKQAVALHKAQEELRAQGLWPPEGEGEEGDGEEEGDEMEAWFDKVITYVAVAVALLAVTVVVGVQLAPYWRPYWQRMFSEEVAIEATTHGLSGVSGSGSAQGDLGASSGSATHGEL